MGKKLRLNFTTAGTQVAVISELTTSIDYQGLKKLKYKVRMITVSVVLKTTTILGRVRLGYSGIRIYSGIYFGIYSGYSAPRGRMAGMEIQVFRNANSSQINAYSHYSNYAYSGLIPNERALKFMTRNSLPSHSAGIQVVVIPADIDRLAIHLKQPRSQESTKSP